MAPPNKRLNLAARRIWNDTFFFSAPQLKRDPLDGGATSHALAYPRLIDWSGGLGDIIARSHSSQPSGSSRPHLSMRLVCAPLIQSYYPPTPQHGSKYWRDRSRVSSINPRRPASGSISRIGF